MHPEDKLILEYDSDISCYTVIDRLTGTTEEFEELSKAYIAGCNLARDLKVKLVCPSYVLMALWLDGLLSYNDIVPFLDGTPLQKEIVKSWGGRLHFMNKSKDLKENDDA